MCPISGLNTHGPLTEDHREHILLTQNGSLVTTAQFEPQDLTLRRRALIPKQLGEQARAASILPSDPWILPPVSSSQFRESREEHSADDVRYAESVHNNPSPTDSRWKTEGT